MKKILLDFATSINSLNIGIDAPKSITLMGFPPNGRLLLEIDRNVLTDRPGSLPE